jgi:hypothetical protein
VAPLLGFVRNRRYVPLDDAGAVRPIDELIRSVAEPIVMKPVRGTLGRGIHIIEPLPDGLRVNGRPIAAAELVSKLRNEHYVVAPRIQQAAYARTIFAGSLNSIRVMTLIDPTTGLPFIPLAVHRFGADCTAPFDGFPNGGVIAPVDVETGRLGTVIRMRQGERRIQLEAHPDTGAQMTGVELPRWADIRAELLALAARMPFLPYIGWDVVITDSGFLINEGNSRPSLRVLQAACGPILKDERVRRFYRAYGIIAD